MNIYKRKGGRFEGRILLGCDGKGRIRYRYLYSRSLSELKEKMLCTCADSGFDAKTVSELLGHSNVNITLNRYVHSSMEMKKKCVDRLNFVA